MGNPVGYGPCLRCGKVGELQPGRANGVPVYCADCAKIRRPRAVGAKVEGKLDAGTLAKRGVNVVKYGKRKSLSGRSENRAHLGDVPHE
jgi:hypothetical protein